MGFYGKIYEQMGDVFNRAKFINAHPNTFTFNAETDDVVIDAESHGDRLPIKAGNNWIAFESGLDDKGNPACVIYHGAPQRDAQGGDRVAAKSIIGQITRTPGISDFLALTDADSTLLTDEEKQQLLDTENLLYFGDKILIYSPVRDEAGHIIRFETREWQLGSIPRLADILSAEGRIVNLESIVGIEEYPGEFGTLAYRTQALEDGFERVSEIAEEAAELATAADESATAAQESAAKAENAAERAAQSAADTSEEVAEFTEETTATLGRYDARIRGNTNAIGAGDSDTIETELDTDSLLEWAQIVIGIIGDEYNDIRNDIADTITDQIHSNDVDIAKLQKDLAQEVADRIADVNAEEAARKQAITDLSSTTNNALSELYDTLNAVDIDLQKQITSNDTDITNLQNNLSKEISDRGIAVAAEQSRAVGVEEQLRTDLTAENTRATGVEQGLDTRLTAVEAKAATNSEKLVGDETVAGSVASKIKTAVDAEANIRIAKDNELADEIGRLADLITDLQSLVEAQQSTISELQEKVVELENIINLPENPDPGTGDEGGEEEPPATE